MRGYCTWARRAAGGVCHVDFAFEPERVHQLVAVACIREDEEGRIDAARHVLHRAPAVRPASKCFLGSNFLESKYVGGL